MASPAIRPHHMVVGWVAAHPTRWNVFKIRSHPDRLDILLHHPCRILPIVKPVDHLLDRECWCGAAHHRIQLTKCVFLVGVRVRWGRPIKETTHIERDEVRVCNVWHGTRGHWRIYGPTVAREAHPWHRFVSFAIERHLRRNVPLAVIHIIPHPLIRCWLTRPAAAIERCRIVPKRFHCHCGRRVGLRDGILKRNVGRSTRAGRERCSTLWCSRARLGVVRHLTRCANNRLGGTVRTQGL